MKYRNRDDNGFNAEARVAESGKDVELDIDYVVNDTPGRGIGVRMSYDAAARLIRILANALDEIDAKDVGTAFSF